MADVKKETDVTLNLESLVSQLTISQLLTLLRTTFVQEQAQGVGQISTVVKDSIATAVGELQSDLASRGVIKYDEDIGFAERMRQIMSNQASSWGYKGNITDFLTGMGGVSNKGNLDQLFQQMVQGAVNHFNTTLTDERIAKSRRLENADSSTQAKDAEVLKMLNK